MRVTTAYRPSEQLIRQAQELARDIGADYVPRGNLTLRKLRERVRGDQFLVVTQEGLRYSCGDERPLFFHPSMALVRIKRLVRGESDPLVHACGVRHGDRVLDCTAGMAADAIVLSYAAGQEGQVIALESEFVQALLLRKGLASYRSGEGAVDEAMRRIQLIHAHHLDYLRTLADDSVDIVYFDPMFRAPLTSSEGLSPLRMIANGEAIHAEAIDEAKRVARHKVVLKERPDSGEFERLGFHITPSRDGTKAVYGVIEC